MTASALPDTMRVSVLESVGTVSVQERPVPVPGPDEVLVQVGSVGICGSDVHYYQHGRIGSYVVDQPLVLGHEAGGVIVATGPGVPSERVGERVALEPGVPCRRCRQCKEGRYNLCPDVVFFATPPVDGAFAEYVSIAADFAHPVPDTLSADAAALIEPLAVAVWACGKAGVGPGSRVLVAGAGPVGLLVTQVSRALGATSVVVSDIAPDRLDTAGQLGATEIVDAREPSEVTGADAFIDCSGAESAVRSGLAALRPAGRAVLVGMGAADLSLPLGLIQERELLVTGTFRYANVYPSAIALAASGQVELDRMVTGRFGLDDVQAALESSLTPGAIKSIVEPGAGARP